MRSVWIFACLAARLAAADFARDIAPVLEARCQLCHGAKQQMSGLRLDQAPAAAQTGRILERITSAKAGHRMPPVGAPLTAAEISAFRSWIDGGAGWPAGYKPGGTAASHWSFQPIRNAQPPAVKNEKWVRNPIDAFVLARLEAEGLTPSPEAAKTTLLRRVTLDLTGLPPTPDEIRGFLDDTSPDAYPRVVERLLSSRHYGERWARPWLDLARYADSDGYEKDLVRPHAWRYRNWVIDALNQDMPFDQFTVEQLAGDLLPNPTTSQVVATGFHRNTLTNREAGVDRAEARFEQLVNRVNTTSTTWLALTVGCAQCHDHKYDPIAQKDFYRLFAIFESAEEREIEAPMPGERERYMQTLPAYLARRNHLLEQHGIAAMQAEWEDGIRFAIDNPGKDLEWDFAVTAFRALFDFGDRVVKTPPDKRTADEQRRLTDYFVTRPGPYKAQDKDVNALLREVRAKLESYAEDLAPMTMAHAFTNAAGYKQTHLRVKGDYRAMGDPVAPGAPAVIAGAGSMTRLEMARWLVSRENPLTARVTVNRAWQELFGRGLVGTSEDFGTQGEKPTHPELLDHLATKFMEDGWSLKKLHRHIVTSNTYRQASHARPGIAARDPANLLLARQSRLRLPAELIRDSALAASGLLDTRIGGPSVRPPQPPGVAELSYASSVKWKESEGPDRYRRGLYIHFQRTTPYPQLVNFDAPDSNVACSRRRSSNSPLQSLNLLNDEVFFEAAAALAARLRGDSFTQRLEYAFLLTTGREPANAERERLGALYDEQEGIRRNDPAAIAPWVAICRVLLNLDEFITRE
ncbi:MAG: PSD1 and planctomycete cytochrome C domain-containing protein [Bryobacteraceae bacterium]|nr:PSD1 and planctomycete cytochrome C domain-containing protein [Bryobacteraceae bacterium]